MLTCSESTQVSETREFRRSFFLARESNANFKPDDDNDFGIWCYRGSEPNPRWKDVDTDRYTKLCTLQVDFSRLPVTQHRKTGGSAGVYYRVDFDIVLQFGLTELKAQVAWKENVSSDPSPSFCAT